VTEKYIWILTPDSAATTFDENKPQPPDPRGKGLGDILFGEPGVNQALLNQSLKRVPVSLSKIEQEMTDLLEGLGQLLTKVQTNAAEVAGMTLQEIELGIEVNGQGQVSLLGFGGQAGGKGAITLKFKRVESRSHG